MFQSLPAAMHSAFISSSFKMYSALLFLASMFFGSFALNQCMLVMSFILQLNVEPLILIHYFLVVDLPSFISLHVQISQLLHPLCILLLC